MFALKGLVWFIKYTRWTRDVVLAQLRLYLFILLTLDIDCGETTMQLLVQVCNKKNKTI